MAISAGTRLGPYEIVSLVGAGGMGEVWRARDPRLAREVAVKVLPEDFLEGEEGRARFEREAKLLAALSHPNIAAVFSFEEIPASSSSSSSRHILVMELLEGATLREKLDSGPVPPKQAVDYALQIAKGLSAAHEKGIVHRDLKPENLIVSKDGHLKLLDFGLAKRTERTVGGEETSAPTESKHTEPGVVMGTVGYMSPEQVRGLPVDHRSDIFSFGAILYEMLSGKKAFKRDTPADTMSAILKEEPAELSASGRNVSPALDQVVRHCLEKDRSNRFQSAKDIAFALSQASGATLVSGRQSEAFAPRRAGVFIATAAVLVAIVAGGVFFLRRSATSPATAPGVKRIAVIPFENLGAAEDGYFADGMTDEVRSKLAALSGLTVIASASSGQYKATTKPPEQIAKELGVGYLLVAKVRWQKSGPASRIRVTPELVNVAGGGSPTTLWQEALERDLSDVFKVQSEIASKVAQALNVVLSGREQGLLAMRPTSNLAAWDAYLKAQDIERKLGGSRAKLAELEKAVALDPGFALAWAEISECHSDIYSAIDPSPHEAEEARNAADRAMTLGPNFAASYEALAGYRFAVLNDDKGFLETVNRGLAIAPNDTNLLSASHYEELRAGRWEQGLAALRRLQNLDPRSVLVANILAQTLQRLRRTGEALETVNRSLALEPTGVVAIETKAMGFIQNGDLAGARAVLASAPKEIDPTNLVRAVADFNDMDWVLDDEQREILLRLTPSAFNDDRSDWGLVLAQASSRRGDTARTRAYAEAARKEFEAAVSRDPRNAWRRALFGISLAYLGRCDEAIREGERAVELRPISKDALSGPYMQWQLVRVHVLCGNQEKALDLLEPLLKVPYVLTSGWLRIDPNFDPLRKNPRFQKLVAGN